MDQSISSLMDTKENSRVKGKLKLVFYFYAILLLFVLLTAASYTWFSISKTPRVSSLSMYVSADFRLELALKVDSEEWGSQLSYADMVPDNTPLRPVTWSEKDGCFYAAVYGRDGRLTGRWDKLSDERNANKNNYESYYCVGTFYARSSENVTVSLSPAVEVEEGLAGAGTFLVGAPLWDYDELAHVNAGQGAENAVRIGIKITHLDENDLPTGEDPIFYIYEPNCDKHTDGTEGYAATPSIDGSDALVPSDRLLTQTHSVWTEADPVENNVQIYTFGEFNTPVELFYLEGGSKVKIQLYIWLEGQDVDCTNVIKEAQILASIQFGAVSEGGSGLTPIE